MAEESLFEICRRETTLAQPRGVVGRGGPLPVRAEPGAPDLFCVLCGTRIVGPGNETTRARKRRETRPADPALIYRLYRQGRQERRSGQFVEHQLPVMQRLLSFLGPEARVIQPCQRAYDFWSVGLIFWRAPAAVRPPIVRRAPSALRPPVPPVRQPPFAAGPPWLRLRQCLFAFRLQLVGFRL